MIVKIGIVALSLAAVVAAALIVGLALLVRDRDLESGYGEEEPI